MPGFKKYFSLDDKKNKNFFDYLSYRKYLRELSSKNTNRKIDINHLENIFNNPQYYLAMKHVPLKERQVLYLNICENAKLNNICKRLKISKKKVLILRSNGIRHFKENLEKINQKNFRL